MAATSCATERLEKQEVKPTTDRRRHALAAEKNTRSIGLQPRGQSHISSQKQAVC